MKFDTIRHSDVLAIVNGDPDSAAARAFPFYRLDAPGMPPAGYDFVRCASQMTSVKNPPPGEMPDGCYNHWLHWLYLRATYDPKCPMWVELNGRPETVRCLIGHLWDGEVAGPVRPAGNNGPVVMVVGKHPAREELRDERNFVGPTSTFFRTALADAGIPQEVTAGWYMTNLVRWVNFDPKGGALPQKWIKDCLPILHQELRLIYPDYLLLLGAEATKAVLCNRQLRQPDGSVLELGGETLKSMVGRFVELQIPRHERATDPEEYHTIKVMAITHPAAVTRTTELYGPFTESLKSFKSLLETGEIKRTERRCERRYVYTERELTDIVSEMLAKPGLKKIAVDAEWQGEYPGEPGAYLRTIQFTDREDLAVVVVLNHAGGVPAFQPGPEAAYAQIKRLLDRDDVQYRGHFPASDIPWLSWVGIDLRHRMLVPATVEEMQHGEYAGVFATDLAEHAIEETAEFKLEIVCMRRLGVPRWDTELNRWKKTYCKAHGIKEDDLEGYGDCPDDVLLPYSAEDVVENWRAAEEYIKPGGLLDRDKFGHDCWLPFHRSMIAFPAFLEMHMQGMRVDRERFEDLVSHYERVFDSLVAKFREETKWPDINIDSLQHCRELLFGEQYNGKKNKDNPGTVQRLRPPGAVSLGLTPIKTTGRRGKDWKRVVRDNEVKSHTPSSDKEVLGIFGATEPIAAHLRDIRFIQKVLSGALARPVRNKKNELVLDAAGNKTYDAGIIAYVCKDNRVHSHFSEVMETGRANSWNPQVHNISNKREADYERISALAAIEYKAPLRTMFVSDYNGDMGEPTVIIGADYSGAELLVVGVAARDQKMIDHCVRGALPDDHPDKYDIHSNIAVSAFRLPCEPSKKGLRSVAKVHLRIAAKNVIFGSNYGRSAAAIARQCKEEGTFIEEHEAQQLLDALFTTYDRVPVFQDACRARVTSPCWIRGPLGRYRRVVPSDDRQVLGELERQFLNFIPQNTVADAVEQALYNLQVHPRREALGYRTWLQLHDAIYLEVPTRSTDLVYHEVLPECMVQGVSFKSCDLDGNPYADSPDYRFSIDRHVYVRWGEGLSADMCKHLTISPEYAHAGDN
jgi:uracil-DNA glycosylase family 4